MHKISTHFSAFSKVNDQIPTAALRHCVYSDLLDFLPIASVSQTFAFISNLSLSTKELNPRFLLLRVSPDIGETAFRGMPPDRLVTFLYEKYGDELGKVSGFYRDASGRLKFNCPQGCALYGYLSSSGHFQGILCQPLKSADRYFLLSSAPFGGPKALRMTASDEIFFKTGILTNCAK